MTYLHFREDLNIYVYVYYMNNVGVGKFLLTQIRNSEIVKEKIEVCLVKILKNTCGKDITGQSQETKVNMERILAMLMKDKQSL